MAMNKTLVSLTALAALGLVGSVVAQDAAQSAPAEGMGTDEQAMTCTDLNEMEPAEATAFLRGYQYAQMASHSALAAADNSTGSKTAEKAADLGAAPEATPADATASAGVGVAAGTGDPSSTGGNNDVGLQAIIDSCFDAPSTPLGEALNGAFGSQT